MGKKLNLGCGKDIKEGYVNVDLVQLPGVEKIVDFDKVPYPFDDNTFEEVYNKHVLEHTKSLLKTMEEIHRICKPGAKIKIICPYFAGHGAYNDPTHTRFFAYRTFEYFNENGYYSKAVFKTLKRRMFFFSSKNFMKSKWFSKPFDILINALPIIYQRFFVYFLPASEIHFELEVKKGVCPESRNIYNPQTRP